MATDQKFSEYRVNSLPNSGLQAGDRYYLSVGGGKYKTFIVSDSGVLTGDAGAEFIEKDTMAQMRALSTREIWALENGYYKGVRLHGYYTKGDTPAPIEYHLSDTAESDDGGSVIEAGGIKLEHDFTGDVDIRYLGVFPSTPDSTADLNRAIRTLSPKGLGTIVPRGDYYINSTANSNRGFVITDNTRLITEQGTRFISLPNTQGTYNIISILGINGFYSNGLEIIGERHSHLGTGGEWGMGLNIRGSSNIYIEKVNVSACWGDGIYFGTYDNRENYNISMPYVIVDDCRRNGISFVNIRDSNFGTIKVSNTNGTNPQRGLDFEPNSETEYLQNINIENLESHSNVNGGVNVQTLAMTENNPFISINITNYKSENEPALVGFGNRDTRVRGNLNITNLVSRNAPSAAIQYRYYFNQPDINIKHALIEGANTSGGAQFYSSTVAVYVDTPDTGEIESKYQSSINIDNLVINKSNPNTTYSVFVQNRITNQIPINNVNIKATYLDRPVNYTSHGSIKTSRVKNLETDEAEFAIYKFNAYDKYTNLNSTSYNILDLQVGYLGQVVEIRNDSGNRLRVRSSIASGTIDGVFEASTPVANKYVESSSQGDFIILKNVGHSGSYARWKILEIKGEWVNTGLNLNILDKFGKDLYGDNSSGTINITESELDNLNRSCMFRVSGLNALGVHIQHVIDNDFALQIRNDNYRSSTLVVRHKGDGVWSEWTTYTPFSQAPAVPNGSSIDDLLVALRTAGILAT